MSEKRTKQLIIRVSPTEFETLTRPKTHPNLASYIRERVLEDGKASDKKTVKFQFPPEVVRVPEALKRTENAAARQKLASMRRMLESKAPPAGA